MKLDFSFRNQYFLKINRIVCFYSFGCFAMWTNGFCKKLIQSLSVWDNLLRDFKWSFRVNPTILLSFIRISFSHIFYIDYALKCLRASGFHPSKWQKKIHHSYWMWALKKWQKRKTTLRKYLWLITYDAIAHCESKF